jgi:hypothetical protein
MIVKHNAMTISDRPKSIDYNCEGYEYPDTD